MRLSAAKLQLLHDTGTFNTNTHITQTHYQQKNVDLQQYGGGKTTTLQNEFVKHSSNLV
jgi:hypothetical protein